MSVLYGFDKNCVCVVVKPNKDVLVASAGFLWEATGEVGVD